jgi:chemotaxis protein CheZ
MTAAAWTTTSPEDAFDRLGRITRQLHEAMTELGLDHGLHAITQEIPDARDRLSHVGHMTETAANKVLNLIDAGQPQCLRFKHDSHSINDAIGQLRLRQPSGNDDVSDVLAHCQMFGAQAAQFAEGQSALLSEIMMTQDFQDLSGQIIKKVIDIISQTEKQLLELLMHSAPERFSNILHPKPDLAGPQVPDKALKQDDVDDLLASLGF